MMSEPSHEDYRRDYHGMPHTLSQNTQGHRGYQAQPQQQRGQRGYHNGGGGGYGQGQGPMERFGYDNGQRRRGGGGGGGWYGRDGREGRPPRKTSDRYVRDEDSDAEYSQMIGSM